MIVVSVCLAPNAFAAITCLSLALPSFAVPPPKRLNPPLPDSPRWASSRHTPSNALWRSWGAWEERR